MFHARRHSGGAPRALLLLVTLPAGLVLGKREHLSQDGQVADGAGELEPALAAEVDANATLSEEMRTAGERSLAPLRRAKEALEAKLKEADAELEVLRREQTALQAEMDAQDEQVATFQHMRARNRDLLKQAREGLKTLEVNYTSSAQEAARILKCLESGGCGRHAQGPAHAREAEMMHARRQLEAELLEAELRSTPAPSLEAADGEATTTAGEGLFSWLTHKMLGGGEETVAPAAAATEEENTMRPASMRASSGLPVSSASHEGADTTDANASHEGGLPVSHEGADTTDANASHEGTDATDADSCTDIRYSWKSVRPTASVCLPGSATVGALLAKVCEEQLGPFGYDVEKCSTEPYVRCQGASEDGEWYSAGDQAAGKATIDQELQGDLAGGHFTCENRVVRA